MAASKVERMLIDLPTESYAGASMSEIDEALTAAKLAFLARMREIRAGGERPPQV